MPLLNERESREKYLAALILQKCTRDRAAGKAPHNSRDKNGRLQSRSEIDRSLTGQAVYFHLFFGIKHNSNSFFLITKKYSTRGIITLVPLTQNFRKPVSLSLLLVKGCHFFFLLIEQTISQMHKTIPNKKKKGTKKLSKKVGYETVKSLPPSYPIHII